MLDDSLKPKYAEYLIETNDPFAAAQRLVPNDTGRALWCATNWANDPEVIDAVNDVKATSDSVNRIATKYDLAQLYWDMANDEKIEPKDRIAAAEKFGAVAGIYDPKQTNNTNINVDAAPRVMIVKDHGSNDNWEVKAAQQQRKLTQGVHVASRQH